MARTIAAAWKEREVVSGQLHRMLTLPEGVEKVPVALILPGSGPVDRNGNFPDGNNESLKLVAHALAERHIATLRIDKRGIGETFLKDRSNEILASLEHGQHVADIPPELAALYHPSVQNYLISWLPLDPARELAKLSCPILIVQGTSDLQISMEDAKRLAAASSAVRLVAVEGMNHVLKSSLPERRENLLSYNTPICRLQKLWSQQSPILSLHPKTA